MIIEDITDIDDIAPSEPRMFFLITNPDPPSHDRVFLQAR